MADPLHGITLEMIVTRLEQHYGWEELGKTDSHSVLHP
jgi:uncharacterized protein (DUF2132 family)